MNGWNVLDEQLKWALNDMKIKARNIFNNIWKRKYIRYPVTGILLIVSYVYMVTSATYLLAGLWINLSHLLTLLMIAIGTTGVFVIMVRSIAKNKYKNS